MKSFRLPDIEVPSSLDRDELPDLLRHWYLGPPARRHMMLRRFGEVNREVPPGSRVLDIGTAWGFNVMALARLGHHPVGIDLVIDQFDVGRAIADANGLAFPVLGGDASVLPFPDESFDAITMVETFEHIYLDDRPAALSECWRVLRPGGTLVLSTPNHAGVVERFKRFTSQHRWLREQLPSMCYPEEGTPRVDYHPYSYHRPLPDDEIASLLETAGFDIVRARHFLFMIKSTPALLYPGFRAAERLVEGIPGVRRAAATVCFVACRRPNQGTS